VSASEGDLDPALRRTPFSHNPQIGARGQQTRQRILDATLRAFGEVGYHQCSIDTITTLAGCSRISFYQYFSGKEDVFRHLAGQVARQLNASTDRLEPITPDDSGWATLRAWVGRYAEIHLRYQPVFRAFPAAAESDTSLASDSVAKARPYLTGLGARVTQTSLAARELDPVIGLLRESLGRTVDDLSTLEMATPGSFGAPAVLDAYTDVVHRTFFGLCPDVNAHRGRSRRPRRVPFGPIMQAALDQAADTPRRSAARAALLAAGRDVLIARGFHGTRVDDIVDAARVSHGSFYRYFTNKDEIAHLLAAQAMRAVSTTLGDIPDLSDDSPEGRNALRKWLRAYHRAQADETALIRVWIDAALQDESLRVDSAAVLHWGRRRMADALRSRSFGDPEIDAIVLLAVLDTFAVRERDTDTVTAALRVIERGFLARPVIV
jgi:AcrR family transcriptional regulator